MKNTLQYIFSIASILFTLSCQKKSLEFPIQKSESKQFQDASQLVKSEMQRILTNNHAPEDAIAARMVEISHLAANEENTQRKQSWIGELDEAKKQIKNSLLRDGIDQLKNSLTQKNRVNSAPVIKYLSNPSKTVSTVHGPKLKRIPAEFLAILNSSEYVTNTKENTPTCQTIVVQDPNPAGPALTYSDLYTARTDVVTSFAQTLVSVEELFYFVRNDIHWSGQYGASQTAEQILDSKSGSAWDKSALMVALLRAKNIPAQVMIGEILVTKDKLKKLYGVEGDFDLFWAHWRRVAGYFKDSSGAISSRLMLKRVGNQTLWVLPHSWVRAYLDNAWVELDPMGPYWDVAPSKYSTQSFPFDFDYLTYLTQPDSEGRYVKPGNAYDALQSQLRQTLGNNLDFNEYGARVTLSREVEDQAMLPIGTIGEGTPCVRSQNDGIPENARYKVRIKIRNDQNALLGDSQIDYAKTKEKALYTSHSAGLFGRVGSLNGQLQLKLADELLFATNYKTSDYFKLTSYIEEPIELYGNVDETKVSTFLKNVRVLAGSVQSLLFSVNPVLISSVMKATQEIKDVQNSAIAEKDLMGRYLNLAGQLFLAKEWETNKRSEQFFSIAMNSYLALRISSSVGYIVDKEDRYLGKTLLDVNIDAVASTSEYFRVGNRLDIGEYKNYLFFRQLDILNGSAAEHQIWDEIFGIPGASAAYVLQEASARAIPVIAHQQLNVNPTDPQDSAIYNQLSPELRSIRDNLKSTNIISEKPFLTSPTDIFILPSGWKGLGYFVIPSQFYGTAVGFFKSLVPGVFSKGGGARGASADQSNASYGENITDNGPTSECPVHIASGEMYHDFVDFNLKGRTQNTNLSFVRRYSSRLIHASGELGLRWTHNYDTRLISPSGDYVNTGTNIGTLNPASVGDIVFIDHDGGDIIFKRNLDNSFTPPASQYDQLVEYSDRYELTRKGGQVLVFSRGGVIPPGKLKSIIDPHGELVTFEYELGKLKRASSELAGSLLFTRDAQGRIIQVTNERDSLSTTYAYDGQGRLASSFDITGKEWTYTYESRPGTKADGLMNSFTDPHLRTVSFIYFDNGKVFQELTPGGGVQKYFYSHYLIDRKTRVLGPNGEETEYRLDEDFNVVETIHHDSSKQVNSYNDKRQVTASTDELGYTTEFQYDARGNQTGVKRPHDSGFRQVAFDQVFDVPTSITPLVGTPTAVTVNANNGDITSFTRGVLGLNFTHDEFGNVLQTTNNRASYSNQTNSDGQLTQVFDARNPQTLTYDSRNRLETRTWASGRSLTYTYDDFDRVLTITDSHGPDTINVYEDKGAVSRLLSRTITDGTTSQTTEFEYDERDRVTKVTDALGRETTTVYDLLGTGCRVQDKPRKVIDPAGRVSRFIYDKRARVIKSVDPRGGVTLYEYNGRGDRIAITDPEGTRTKFRYDGNGRMIRRERPTVRTSNGKVQNSVEVTNYIYDQADRLIRQEVELPHFSNGTSIGFLVVDFEYDGIDRMIRRRQYKQAPLGGIVELYEDSNFTYENQLDATLMTSANNAVINLGFGYEATPPFAVTSYSTLAAQAGNPLNLIEGNFTVTPAVEHPIGIVAKDSAQLLSRSYDPAGRLTGIEADFASQSLDTTIAYDGFGRKQTVTHSNGLTGNYQYDNLNRTTGITWNGAGENFSQALIYGALTGNIDQVIREFGTFTYGHDATDQLTSVAYSGTTQLPTYLVNRSFNYDFAGNRATDTANGTTKTARNIILGNDKRKIYPDQDGQGRIWQKVSKTENKTELFDYQTDGKLIRYREYQSSTLTKDVFYYTDALGRRVAKKLSINNQTWTNSFAYLASDWQILLDQNGVGEQELLIDGLGIDEHLGKITPAGPLAFTTDHLGTVINDEATSEKKATGPFGEHLGIDQVLTQSSAAARYGFTGREHDSERDSMHLRNRTLDVETGRFTSEDPIGFQASDTNLFRYVKNQSTLKNDPFGLCEELSDQEVNHMVNEFFAPTPSEQIEILIYKTFFYLYATEEQQQSLHSQNPFYEFLPDKAKEADSVEKSLIKYHKNYPVYDDKGRLIGFGS